VSVFQSKTRPDY